MCLILSSTKDDRGEKEIIKLLTNDLVIKIFTTLLSEPMNTRKLSSVLGVDETLVSRKLRAMEKAGLVESKWIRSKGKNVKVYYPRTNGYSIRVSSRGVEIRYGDEEVVTNEKDVAKIPSSGELFVGRDKELEILRDNKRKFLFVIGLPGIGKTSLVSRYAENSGYRVVWIDILETTTLNGIARHIAYTLGEEVREYVLQALKSSRGDPISLVKTIVNLLKSKEILLVLDNFHLNADPAIEILVKELALTSELKGKAVVISRNKPRFYLSSDKTLYLGPLGEKEALKLLRSYGITGRVAVKAYKLLNGHPYLLILFSKEYRRNPRVLEELARDVKKYILQEIINDLTHEDRVLLDMMCIVKRMAPLRLFKNLGLDQRIVRKSIEKLLSNLIIHRSANGYQIVEFVRDFYCRDVYDRETYHYVAATYYSQSNDYEDLLESLYHYIMSHRYDETLNVLRKLGDLVIDNEVVITPLLPMVSEISGKARDNLVKAWAFFIQARNDVLEGFLEKALKTLNWVESIAVDHGDYKLVLFSKIEKSLVYRYLNEYDKAVRELKRAWSIVEKTRLRNREETRIRILMGLGATYLFKGELDKAVKIYDKLLEKHLSPTDLFRKALIHGWKGLIYRLLYEPSKSVNELNESIKLFKQLGSRHSLAIAYHELALTHYIASDLGKAVEYVEKAINLLKDFTSQEYAITQTVFYIDYAVFNALRNELGKAAKALDKAGMYMREYGIETPELKTTYSVAEIVVLYRRGELDKVGEKLRELDLSILDKISLFRRVFTLSIIASITCNKLEDKILCSKFRSRLDEAVKLLINNMFNRENYLENMKYLEMILK